ncbi:MAG: DUF4111 domain-containing protein [Chloroflexota bacterium]
MTGLDEVPATIRDLCEAFLAGLRSILGENLVGVYFYGAITFPDSQGTVADLDYHVILNTPLDDETREAIHGLRGSLARDFPPLGNELDGYFVTVQDAKRTSRAPTQMHPLWRLSVDDAWALHCAHICAGQVITLFGPDPLMVYPEPAWDDLEAALVHELSYVQEHQKDAPAYGILNACRILLSVRSRDVVISKRGAAVWALAHVPQRWHDAIRLAMLAYERPVGEAEGELLRVSIGPFLRYVEAELGTFHTGQLPATD